MTKKSPSTINKAAPGVLIALLLAVWQGLSSLGVVPKYMLPSPADVVKAFFADFPLLVSHSKTCLLYTSHLFLYTKHRCRIVSKFGDPLRRPHG